MKHLITIPIIFSILFSSCGNKPNPDSWKDYLGTWQSTDEYQVTVEVKQLFTEGRFIEKRFILSIPEDSVKAKLPEFYFSEGNYSFQYGPSDAQRKKLEQEQKNHPEDLPRFKINPYSEFIAKSITYPNPDTAAPNYSRHLSKIYYIGLLENGELQRRVSGLPDVNFKRVK